jgi:large subunit ribosomal protein L14
MIQKGSILSTGDNSGVLKTRVFHVYKGSKGRIGFVGDFFKVSAREVLPENPIPKKSKHKAIVIRTKYKNTRKDGSYILFDNNALILLKKRLTPKSTLLRGPITKNIRRKKFLSSFTKII